MSSRTVVPWVVVLLGIGLIWYTRRGPAKSVFPDVASDVHACKENLRAVYAGLREYARVHGSAPAPAGQGFLRELIASGTWEDTPENRERLTCPGSGGYAGRDTTHHPLPRFPSGGADLQTLIACDNVAGLNHAGAMNVLHSDGTVVTLQLAELIERGTLPAGTESIPVGPDSPLEALRVLLPN